MITGSFDISTDVHCCSTGKGSVKRSVSKLYVLVIDWLLISYYLYL